MAHGASLKITRNVRYASVPSDRSNFSAVASVTSWRVVLSSSQSGGSSAKPSRSQNRASRILFALRPRSLGYQGRSPWLVSWGDDGAIRFWSLDGAPLPGGRSDAHSGFVWGVLPLHDRLISWGSDAMIRFWGIDGVPLPDRITNAHLGYHWDVLTLADRLVCWGDDGSIRFWSLDGAPLPGGRSDAHSRAIRGMLSLGDRLVSWGEDGAIRFWSLDGAPLPGGALDAHFRGIKYFNGVRGLLWVGDRLVSWGGEGAIRFWSLDGKPLSGGARDAHSGWVDVLHRHRAQHHRGAGDGRDRDRHLGASDNDLAGLIDKLHRHRGERRRKHQECREAYHRTATASTLMVRRGRRGRPSGGIVLSFGSAMLHTACPPNPPAPAYCGDSGQQCYAKLGKPRKIMALCLARGTVMARRHPRSARSADYGRIEGPRASGVLTRISR
jgi:hypothetical protein